MNAKQRQFVKCRTYGHGWEECEIPRMNGNAAKWGFRLSLRCARCATERHDVYDYRGDISVRSYVYPDGYRDAFVDEKPTRAEFRRMWLSRERV